MFVLTLWNNPVEYVTVGAPGSFYGTITDVNGRFNLLIPDSLKEKSLTFSHISYEPLIQPMEVVLIDHSFPIPEVIIPGNRRRLRVKSLNRAGIRIPLLPPGMYSIPSPLQNPEAAKRAEEAGIHTGVLLDLKKETWIRGIKFDILRNSFDTLKFRVVVYRKDISRYIPLILLPPFSEDAGPAQSAPLSGPGGYLR